MLDKISTKNNEVNDRVVIMSDNGTADIAYVDDIDNERIMCSSPTADYSIPVADTKAYATSRGLIYSYPAEHDLIQDTQRIAALERSTVLKQITMYERTVSEPEKVPLLKILMYVAIFILIFVLAVT